MINPVFKPPASRRKLIMTSVLTLVSLFLFLYGLSLDPSSASAYQIAPKPPTVYLPLISGGYPFHLALKDVAQQHGIQYVGMSLGFSPNHTAYLESLSETILPDFNSITPGNPLKMIFIHRCPPAHVYANNTPVVAWVLTDEGDHDNDGATEGRGCAMNLPVVLPSPTLTLTLSTGEYLLPTPVPNSYDDWEWDWEQVDGIVLWAKEHDMRVYGTPLIWNHAVAEWLGVMRNSGVSERELTRIMRDHIRTIMYHYCQPPFLYDDGTPVIYAYDVVNEAIHFTSVAAPAESPSPTASPVGLDQGIWNFVSDQSLTGDNYVRHAFTYAREVMTDPLSPCYDKDIRLIYNDRWTQSVPTLSTGTYSMTQSLLYDLSPTPSPLAIPLVDGVGMQMHFEIFYRFSNTPGTPPDISYPVNSISIQQEMQRISDLGLEVKITEADVALIQVARPPTFCGYDPNDPRVTQTPIPDNARPLCSLPEPNLYFELPALTQPITMASQAYVYSLLAEACRDTPTCTGFTIWGLEDEGSWKRDFHPLIFTAGVPTIYTVTPTPTEDHKAFLRLGTRKPAAVPSLEMPPLTTPAPRPRMTPKPAYHALFEAWMATPQP